MSDLRCPCCFGTSFEQHRILPPELVEEWQLSADEHRYIDEQQGLRCNSCGATLRSMALAQAIMRSTSVPFTTWVRRHSHLRILEINEAGTLHPLLRIMPRHRLASYPAVDIMQLPYPDEEFDLVLHSDTLEHVSDPVAGLRECRRVLCARGRLCYTVPIVVGRLTSMRSPSAPSYHGLGAPEFLVYTEYGADAWRQPIEAGFATVNIVTLQYPAGVALEARGRASGRASAHADA